MDNVAKINVELEAEDSLGVLLKRIRVELPVRGDLRKQAKTIVERLTYLDTLKVIEVDGVSDAALIRSEKPAADGFTEVVLRGGTSIVVERRGAPLHISRQTLSRLTSDLEKIGA
jgi:hypothetical protein